MKNSPATEPVSIKELALNIVIPSVYPGALLVMWFAPKHFGFGSHEVVYAGWVLGIAGFLLWILALAHLGRALAVLPGARRLVTRGVYRYLRHPVYAGINLTLLGLALCLGSQWGLVYYFVLVVPLNLVRARQEDRALKKQFGDEFEEWRQSTWL